VLYKSANHVGDMLLCLDEILFKSAVLAKFGLGDFLLCDSTKFGVNIMNERCVLVTKFHALGILFLSVPLGVKPSPPVDLCVYASNVTTQAGAFQHELCLTSGSHCACDDWHMLRHSRNTLRR